jgi:hypothetical protein
MTVTQNYMSNRRLRGPNSGRPQAMVWADEAPSITENGEFIPVGYEIGSDPTNISAEDLSRSFMIISDHNRSEINIINQRIEQRQRMANGTMRSFFIADKLIIDTSWLMLPSRSFKNYPNFNQETGLSSYDKKSPDANGLEPETQYTVDGGAGGAELLDWYENHTGPFWVLLSYDKYPNFGTDDAARQNLKNYSQVVQMYISSFNYSVVKRGGNNFDMWDVSVSLEEV